MSISTESISAAALKELLEEQRHLREELSALRSQVASGGGAAAGGKVKKARKTADPDAPKAPVTNPWILFTQRVEGLVRAVESAAEVPKESKMRTVVVKQFASDLKSRKPYEEWADEEIQAALADWKPPEVSKQAAAGKTKKSSTGSAAEGGESDGEAAGGGAAAAEKPKRKWSEEAKAAAAAKRAAKKAAAAGGGAAEAPAAEDGFADPPEAAAAAPAPAKKIALKPKPAAAPAKVDLRFYSWSHGGTDYFTNDRGDVVSTEFEWVGRFDKGAGKIDETVEEPADLAEAEMRE
jgi:ribosomal protein L29